MSKKRVRLRIGHDGAADVPDVINGRLQEIADHWQVSKNLAVSLLIAEAYGKIASSEDYIPDDMFVVVRDCSKCGDPITALDPIIIIDDSRVCYSCYRIDEHLKGGSNV